jgi:hypothetical protein
MKPVVLNNRICNLRLAGRGEATLRGVTKGRVLWHSLVMENKHWAAYQLAYLQGGIIRSEQLIELGFSKSMLARKAQDREWHRIYRAIYKLIEMNQPRDLLRAAVAILPTAVASHEAAAQIHEISFQSLAKDTITVTVISETTHDLLGVTVHRNSDLLPHHLEFIDGLELTTRIRTIFDLVQKLGRRLSFALLDQEMMLNNISLQDVADLVEDLARQGKPGSTIFKEYVEDRDWVDGRSPLHMMALEIIDAAMLPTPEEEHHLPWEPWKRFDLAFPHAKLAIELDGLRYHSTPEQMKADRQRDRDAHANEWVVLRFTWDDLVNQPDRFVKHLQEHLARSLD